jgi:hypothetical protein
LGHGLHRNQLYGWRREFRSAVVADDGVPTSKFVPIDTHEHAADLDLNDCHARTGASSCDEPGVESTFLGEVLRLLRATA